MFCETKGYENLNLLNRMNECSKTNLCSTSRLTKGKETSTHIKKKKSYKPTGKFDRLEAAVWKHYTKTKGGAKLRALPGFPGKLLF